MNIYILKQVVFSLYKLHAYALISMKRTLLHITVEGLQQLAEKLNCIDRFGFSHRHITIKPKNKSAIIKWIILVISIGLVATAATYTIVTGQHWQLLVLVTMVAYFVYWLYNAAMGSQVVSIDLEERQIVFVPAKNLFNRKNAPKKIDIDTIQQVELRELGHGNNSWFRISFYGFNRKKLNRLDFDRHYPEDHLAKKLHDFFELVLRENKKIKAPVNS
jgi:hypothetical protein